MSQPHAHTGFSLWERIGEQPRDPEFSPGNATRVYEVPYGDYAFGASIGAVGEVASDALLVPAHVVDGQVEIAPALLNLLGPMFAHGLHSLESLTDTARAGSDDMPGLSLDLLAGYWQQLGANPTRAKALARQVAKVSPEATLGAGPLRLEYGEAAPVSAGKLALRGIRTAVIVNVTPPPTEGGYTRTHQDVATFVTNAAEAAAAVGARSLAVPLLGMNRPNSAGVDSPNEVYTGFFDGDIVCGVFAGARAYANAHPSDGSLTRIDVHLGNGWGHEPVLDPEKAARIIHQTGALTLLNADHSSDKA